MITFLIIFIPKKAFLNANNRLSLEKLLKKIYVEDNYNNEVRPFGEEDKTKVFTEVKLLQIDLDEKYQQLVNNLNIFRKFFF
jgi:hypothetical protein